jgi:protein phosphatase
MLFDSQPGDRWLICSDGLSSYVSEDKILASLANHPTARGAAERLIKESLDQGAPDNVTVVVVDVDEAGGWAHVPPITVGSAAQPLSFETDVARKPVRLPTLLLHPLKATKPDDSHFEPESDDYLAELIREDKRRARRRRVVWLVGIILIGLGIAAGIIAAYQWTQTRYFVGPNGDTVAIYQGVQQDLGPIELSHVYIQTSVRLDSLPQYTRTTIEATITVDDLAEAQSIVSGLTEADD